MPWGLKPLGDRRWRLSPAWQGLQVCVPGGRTRSQMTKTPATLHPSAPAPPPGTQPLPTAGLLTRGLSSPPPSPWGAFMGIRRGTFMPQGCGLDVSATVHHSLAALSGWPWPIWHRCHILGPCLEAFSSRGQAQGWFSVHLRGLEAQNPRGGERCLTRVTRIPRELNQQHHPGGVRTKATKASTAQGMQRFSCTGFQEDPPWPLPKSSGWGTGGTDVPAQARSCPESGSQSWQEGLGPLWPHLDDRASRPPCLPIDSSVRIRKGSTHLGGGSGPSRCFCARKRG